MSRKIINLLLASTLFLIISLATTPLGNTVTWSGETGLLTPPASQQPQFGVATLRSQGINALT